MAPSPSLPSLDAVRAETAWLRRLAGALTRDDSLAEDAVQETWLARLLHPPGDRGAPAGWLRVVLRNAVRKRARGDSRRQGRERAALVPESGPDPQELAVRLEAQRLVAELVLGVDEPYRSTVLLCYYEGLAPAEIARRQGVPAGTVRWRLKTGLDRLRVELDGKYATPRRWRALLLPLVPGDRGLAPWTVIMATKATTKGAVLVVAILLALLGGRRWIERGSSERAPGLSASADARASVVRSGPHPFGTYRPGARTALPRFLSVGADAAAPRRFVTAPLRLDRSGKGLRNRLEHTPPNFKAIQAQLHGKLDDLQQRADRCLVGWGAADPALEKGVMLRIDLDGDGLQAVSIDDLVDVPSGPLRCLGDAVYAIDWGGIVPQPMTLTVPQRYAAIDAGGSPVENR